MAQSQQNFVVCVQFYGRYKQVIGNPNDQQQRKLRMEKIAKHFEKYLPLDDNEKEALTSRLTGQKHNN